MSYEESAIFFANLAYCIPRIRQHNSNFLYSSLIIDIKKFIILSPNASTVKLGVKELFDKEQIGNKEPFPVTNLPFTS